MSHKVIILPTFREGEQNYIKRYAKANGFDVSEKKSRSYVAIRIEGEEARSGVFAMQAVSEIITTFYKFRVLEDLIRGYESSEYDYYAYLGALLSVELEEERKRVYTAVSGLKEIAIESLVELRLRALKEAWFGLKELASMLLAQCDGSGDVYSLIPYFITGDSFTPHITVSGSEELTLYSGGKSLNVPEFTENREQNLVLALMRERPNHIVIGNKEKISEALLNTLRALGE